MWPSHKSHRPLPHFDSDFARAKRTFLNDADILNSNGYDRRRELHSSITQFQSSPEKKQFAHSTPAFRLIELTAQGSEEQKESKLAAPFPILFASFQYHQSRRTLNEIEAFEVC